MTLAHRIIATLLIDRNGQLVKGKQFASDRVIPGPPVAAARVMATVREIDELVLLFVHASADGVPPDERIIEQVVADCHIPVTIGGGINTLDIARTILRVGADKVVIGRAFRENPLLIRHIGDVAGSQAVVVSIDHGPSGHYEMYCDCAVRARSAFVCGAGEILLQSIDRDGMMNGYDLDTISMVRPLVDVPIVASGGCGEPAHMAEAILAGADALAAGAMYAFTDQTPLDAKMWLASQGFVVRIPVRA